jgi:hypothetical protein
MGLTLLEEIERDASDSRVPIGNLLRKCQILAARLDNAPLRDWVNHELNGYPADAAIPDYRVGLPTLLCGDFQNLAWRVSHQVLPIDGLPADIQERVGSQDLREGVAELEHIQRTAEGGAIRLYLSPNLWAGLAGIVGVQGYAPTNMWRELSASQIEGLLDQVRNRALNLALEIERLDPRAGGSAGGSGAVSADRVTQVFNAVIMGENVQYAPASANAYQTIVKQGDLDSLNARLRELGIDEADLDELAHAIDADGGATGIGPGPNVNGWLGRVTMRLARTAGGIGASASAGLIAAAVAKFLGLA